MAVIRDTIIDGRLHVAGDIVSGGIVTYPEENKKISCLFRIHITTFSVKFQALYRSYFPCIKYAEV